MSRYQHHPYAFRPGPSSTERRGNSLYYFCTVRYRQDHLVQAARGEHSGTLALRCPTRRERLVPAKSMAASIILQTIPTFQAMIDRHEFVEWARVYGHLYGTPRRTVSDKIEQGIDVLLEIDVQGALQVKKFDDAVSIFILPPSMTVLRQRLLARASDSSEEIQRRLQRVKEEVWSYREYAYIVRKR